MSTWSIKDSLRNLFAEGEYNFRVEEWKHKSAGESAKNAGAPMVYVKLTCVSPGEYENKTQFCNFTILPQSIGILGTFLANTGVFDLDDEEDDKLSDDNELLASQLNDRLAGKVFRCEYKHQKVGTQVYSNIRVIEPAGMGAYS